MKLKVIALLLSPILLFFVLVYPYHVLNSEVLVDVFGCGCPVMDEQGNFVEPDFNANDFTALFWLFVSLVVTGAAALLSRKLPRNKLWLKILYIAGMLAVSLFIAYNFHQSMMWN